MVCNGTVLPTCVEQVTDVRLLLCTPLAALLYDRIVLRTNHQLLVCILVTQYIFQSIPNSFRCTSCLPFDIQMDTQHPGSLGSNGGQESPINRSMLTPGGGIIKCTAMLWRERLPVFSPAEGQAGCFGSAPRKSRSKFFSVFAELASEEAECWQDVT